MQASAYRALATNGECKKDDTQPVLVTSKLASAAKRSSNHKDKSRNAGNGAWEALPDSRSEACVKKWARVSPSPSPNRLYRPGTCIQGSSQNSAAP